MSATCRVRLGLLAIGLCGLALTDALAQQATTQNQAVETRPGQSQIDSANQDRRGEAATPGERAQPGRNVQGRQPYTANFRGTQNAANQGLTAETYFANCLLKKNQGEIEIAQLAIEQSQNPQVKEFAQMLVRDHQKLVDQLQQIAGASAATGRTDSTSLDAAAARPESERAPAEPARVPGSSATDTTTPSRDTRDSAEADKRSETASTTTVRQGGMQGGALMQVANIEEKIADRCLQAMREELQQKSGAEFDECFVGAQVGGHMHMLAALEVLGQESQGQLKQIAAEARPRVQQHLDHAKQLAKQLKSGEGRSTAQRPTATETQR